MRCLTSVVWALVLLRASSADPCACSLQSLCTASGDCYVGCQTHGDGNDWCYVANPADCSSAASSSIFETAQKYKSCDKALVCDPLTVDSCANEACECRTENDLCDSSGDCHGTCEIHGSYEACFVQYPDGCSDDGVSASGVYSGHKYKSCSRPCSDDQGYNIGAYDGWDGAYNTSAYLKAWALLARRWTMAQDPASFSISDSFVGCGKNFLTGIGPFDTFTSFLNHASIRTENISSGIPHDAKFCVPDNVGGEGEYPQYGGVPLNAGCAATCEGPMHARVCYKACVMEADDLNVWTQNTSRLVAGGVLPACLKSIQQAYWEGASDSDPSTKEACEAYAASSGTTAVWAADLANLELIFTTNKILAVKETRCTLPSGTVAASTNTSLRQCSTRKVCKFVGGLIDAYRLGMNWFTGALKVSVGSDLADSLILQEFAMDQCSMA